MLLDMDAFVNKINFILYNACRYITMCPVFFCVVKFTKIRKVYTCNLFHLRLYFLIFKSQYSKRYRKKRKVISMQGHRIYVT